MTLTVQKAIDIIEINQVKSSYSWYYDTCDLEGLLNLFTDDAVCDFGPYGSWQGKDAIRECYSKNIWTEDECFATMHNTTNPIIEVNGDKATGKWFVLDHILGPAGQPPLVMMATYMDEFRRVNGEWKISRVRMDFHWSSEAGRIKGQMEKTHGGSRT
jgi:ketosteroid isomerase-like protein